MGNSNLGFTPQAQSHRWWRLGWGSLPHPPPLPLVYRGWWCAWFSTMVRMSAWNPAVGFFVGIPVVWDWVIKGVGWTPAASVPLQVRRTGNIPLLFSCLPCCDLSGAAILPGYIRYTCVWYVCMVRYEWQNIINLYKNKNPQKYIFWPWECYSRMIDRIWLNPWKNDKKWN